MLENFVIVGSESSFHLVTGQHFGLGTKLRNEFGGCTEGGLVQSSYLFCRYSTRFVEQRLARILAYEQTAGGMRNQRARLRISNERIFP